MDILSFLHDRGVSCNVITGCLHVLGDVLLPPGLTFVMPRKLAVHGDLIVSDSNLGHLPSDKLYVKNTLDISNTKIRSFPADIFVGGSFFARHCDLIDFPALAEVHGDLDLSESHVASMPRRLQVHGALNLYRASIDFPPDQMKVDGRLYLIDSHLGTVPRNLEVNQDLILSDLNSIKTSSKGLQVKGKVLCITNISGSTNSGVGCMEVIIPQGLSKP